MQPWLFPAGLPGRAIALFSYWPGYLREPRLRIFLTDLAAAGGQLLLRHASGHAHPDDLRRFVEPLRPRVLFPVHITSPSIWAEYYPATILARDGESIELK
jgi:mRNA degradation ribonuclease J1/J2